MDFSIILKEILNKRQLKQAELCRMTGIQTSLMSDYLNGKKSPAISNAIEIANALGISLDSLVGKEQDDNITNIDHEAEELLETFNCLVPTLKQYLLRQAKELQEIQNTGLNIPK